MRGTLADTIINAWLDQMTLAGFTAARWWMNATMGAAVIPTEHVAR